mmetsp:Transcript_89241/g.204059  ORF Transcript_89241/g.204059 Transcript_89241/m.204059 type:complete len:219 (-) Transcript_89241:41-697(-)
MLPVPLGSEVDCLPVTEAPRSARRPMTHRPFRAGVLGLPTLRSCSARPRRHTYPRGSCAASSTPAPTPVFGLESLQTTPDRSVVAGAGRGAGAEPMGVDHSAVVLCHVARAVCVEGVEAELCPVQNSDETPSLGPDRAGNAPRAPSPGPDHPCKAAAVVNLGRRSMSGWARTCAQAEKVQECGSWRPRWRARRKRWGDALVLAFRPSFDVPGAEQLVA